MNKRILSLALPSLLFFTACNAIPLDTSADISTHLFLAKENKKDPEATELEFYDFDFYDLEASYSVTLPDPHGPSRFDSGNNDSVQYDSELDMVLFATDGRNMMDGPCLNADGTCNGRLYAWTPSDTAPRLFWDSEGSISGWLLDPKTHTVWVNTLSEIFTKDYDGKTAPTLVQLDLKTGTMLAHFEFSADGPLQLATDGTLSTLSGSGGSGGFGFHQLNPSAAIPLSYMELAFNDEAGTKSSEASLSGLSPDGKHFVYFSNLSTGDDEHPVESTLMLSSMQQDDVGSALNFDGESSNYNIYWAADSQHFVVQAKKYGLVQYDLNGNTSTLHLLDYAYPTVILWAPSTRYLLTAMLNYQIYDLETGGIHSFSEDLWGWPLGATFY